MVISDFNIISLGQTSPLPITLSGIGCEIVNSKIGYNRHWRVLRNKGVWYEFYPEERVITKQYNDEFFDLEIDGKNYVAIPMKKHLKDLIKIISYCRTMSPTRELLVLIRLDEYGESEHTIEITFSDFIKTLIQNRLLFNRVYHITSKF